VEAYPRSTLEEPATEPNSVATLAADQAISIIGEPEEANGYSWWQIQLGDRTEGWLAGDILKP
jgi:hypothetical protein